MNFSDFISAWPSATVRYKTSAKYKLRKVSEVFPEMSYHMLRSVLSEKPFRFYVEDDGCVYNSMYEDMPCIELEEPSEEKKDGCVSVRFEDGSAMNLKLEWVVLIEPELEKEVDPRILAS